MSVTQIRIFAVVAAIAAALLRLAAEPLTPPDDTGWTLAGTAFLLLLLGSMAGPIAAYAVLTGPARRRPESLRPGTVPGTLIAPARLLRPGSQLILGAWLIANLLQTDTEQQSRADVRIAWLGTAVAVVVLLMGVIFTFSLIRPRPHLLLDADGVTIHPWHLRRTTRVLWDDLHRTEPVWTSGDPISRVHLARAGGDSVTIFAEHLDVEPAYLAWVMSGLAAAPDRRALIDSHRSSV